MTKQMMNLRRIRAAVFIGLNFSLRQNQKKLSMKKMKHGKAASFCAALSYPVVVYESCLWFGVCFLSVNMYIKGRECYEIKARLLYIALNHRQDSYTTTG